MQQCFNFDLITLTDATAQQLAWHRDRDNPTDGDFKEAEIMVYRWNVARMSLGLAPLDDNYEPPEVKAVEIESEDEE